jgi:hypothetical protein
MRASKLISGGWSLPLECGVVVAAAIALGTNSMADTLISMPAPASKSPPQALVITTDAGPSPNSAPVRAAVTASEQPALTDTSATAQAAANNISEGDIALFRYSQARSGTFDTYFDDGSFLSNGVRVYTYPRYFPQWVWGPFWGWGFGFPFCW